ncbi:MAG: hypothetical protein LBT66_04795 [Methanobrevibacter sp.]|jgi:hypothetical protein|nr:hypothetical protein [Candidatus Methanovirga meridionalis]
MYKIKGIYDGKYFKFETPLPSMGKYEIEIKFIKPINNSQEKILEFFNIWDKNDENFEEIIKERKNFSLDRMEI